VLLMLDDPEGQNAVDGGVHGRRSGRVSADTVYIEQHVAWHLANVPVIGPAFTLTTILTNHVAVQNRREIAGAATQVLQDVSQREIRVLW
jgi:hypothetical protein